MIDKEKFDFIKRVLLGSLIGASTIESRMASSSPFAVDPLDSIYGLRDQMEKIRALVKDKKMIEAEALTKKYLEEYNLQ